MILTLVTLMSITAAIYVSFGRSLLANSIWSISNIGFIWYNVMIGEKEMILLFGIYEITALYGVYNLGIKPYLENKNENTT